jgi:hypothetical protein
MRLIVFSLLLFLVMLAIAPAPLTAAAQQSSASQPAPLKEAEIIKGLVGGISSKRMAALVSQYGVDFALTPESEERLRSAGADAKLLTAIRTEAAKRASATLLVTTDMDCDWKLDGVSQGRLKAGDAKTVPVSLGEHLVQAVSADGQDSWKALATVSQSMQKAIEIPLLSVRQARLEKEQKEAAERLLPSGSYQVQASGLSSTWRLNVNGADITGISEWPCCPGPRQDPLNGQILDNSVTITRDCSGQGWPQYCLQTYVGTIKGDQIIGTWSGKDNTYLNSGGKGEWSMQLRPRMLPTTPARKP